MSRAEASQKRLNEVWGEGVMEIQEYRGQRSSTILHTPSGITFEGSVLNLLKGFYPKALAEYKASLGRPKSKARLDLKSKAQARVDKVWGEGVFTILTYGLAHGLSTVESEEHGVFECRLHALCRKELPKNLLREPKPVEETDAGFFHLPGQVEKAAKKFERMDSVRNVASFLELEPWEIISEAYITSRYRKASKFTHEGYAPEPALYFLAQNRLHELLKMRNREKRTGETLELHEESVPGRAAGLDETFRLEAWAEDPIVKAALKNAAGWSMAEVASEHGVTRQAMEQRIQKKIQEIRKAL